MSILQILIPFSKTVNLHVFASGLNIKVLVYNPSNDLPNHAEEKTFYVEDDFHDFLLRHGFIALKGLNCCKSVRSIDDLHPGEVYQGLRPPGS